jgi:hypothetical protein
MVNREPTAGSSGTLLHPSLGLVRYQLTEVSDDPDTQVAQVIGLMDGYAAADSRSPQILRDVYRAAQSHDALQDTFDYVRGRMTFTPDESLADSLSFIPKWRPVVETLIRPCDQAILPNPCGDCDDYSMYGASHLLARGVPCSYVTVAADQAEPTTYSHVYLAAYPDSGPYAGMRVPMDLSHGPRVGWETADRFHKRREWPLGMCAAAKLLGLGLMAGGLVWLCRNRRTL